MWLFAIFVAVPIIEIALFIQVGGWIGLWPTLAIVVATAIVGSLLLRTQGVQTVARLRQSVSSGENPMNPIAHGALILVAAVLLLTPGFFTDATGLALLIPPIRSQLIKAGASRLAASAFVVRPDQGAPYPTTSAEDIVDADFTVVDEKPANDQRTPSGWTKKPN